MLKEALLVGTGGFAGSVCRYLISMVMAGTVWIHPVHWGTLTVNVAGSFLAGFFLAAVSGQWYYLAVAGFCGGFTTFSAFSVELLTMFRNGHYGYGIAYIAVSVAVCLLFVWVGTLAGGAVSAGARGWSPQ